MIAKEFTSTVCFAGAGLMDRAIEAAGGRILQAIEFDPQIARIYRANFPEVNLIESAIEAVDPNSLEPTDHVGGSPSCRKASEANKFGESPEDISAAQAFLGIIAAMHRRTGGTHPKWVTLENVRGYANFRSFGIIEGGLRALGYQVGFQFLDAADFGVPQSRKRLMLRAALPGCAPAFIQLSLFDAGELAPIVPPPRQRKIGWFEAIGHLIPNLPETTLAQWQIGQLVEQGWAHPTTMLNACDTSCRQKPVPPKKPAFTQRCWNAPNSNAPKILLLDSKNSRNSGGGATKKLVGEPAFTLNNYGCEAHSSKLLIDGKGSANFGGGLSLKTADRPSFTLCASDGKRASKIAMFQNEDCKIYLENADIRLVTPECGEILQMYGCDRKIVFPEGISSIYKWKAIGNGVPYLLGLAVMKSLVQC